MGFPALISWGYEPQPSGVLVLEVVHGSPAFHSGISAGNAIIAMNETPIRNVQEFLEFMGNTKPNQTVMLEIIHDSQSIQRAIKLAKHPKGDTGFLGVRVYNYFKPKWNLSPFLPYRLLFFLNWTAIISISLAIFNALPISILDGDKILGEVMTALGLSGRVYDVLKISSFILLALNIAYGLGAFINV